MHSGTGEILMTKSKAHIAGTAGLGILSVAGVLLAESAAAQEATGATIEEIIVTASRREETLQNAAVAVTVLDVGAAF